MKTLLLTIVLLFGLIGSVAGQKKKTILGDLVIGEVTETNEATREITITYPGKEGPEVFTGMLTEGYEVKLKDGSRRELKINEITPGIRVRAFYKSGHVNISGQKKKINRIVRFEFLGKDEFVRLRNQLKISPSTAVARAENYDLPSTSPLKIYVSSPYLSVYKEVADWIIKWNEKHADSLDKLEPVSEMDQADVLVVVAKGSDSMVGVFRLDQYGGNNSEKTEWSQATLHLAVKDGDGLKVLWTDVGQVLSTQNVDVLSKRRASSFTDELEKRLNARNRKLKQ